MKSLLNIFLILSIILAYSITVKAHEMGGWGVSDECKKAKNPVTADEKSLSYGKELYDKHCASCHGEKGDGKGPKSLGLAKNPSNFSDKHMMEMMSDGEIFCKISKGNLPMPQWEKKLTENERWDLVNYIKTFAK